MAVIFLIALVIACCCPICCCKTSTKDNPLQNMFHEVERERRVSIAKSYETDPTPRSSWRTEPNSRHSQQTARNSAGSWRSEPNPRQHSHQTSPTPAGSFLTVPSPAQSPHASSTSLNSNWTEQNTAHSINGANNGASGQPMPAQRQHTMGNRLVVMNQSHRRV